MGRPLKPKKCACPDRADVVALFKPAGVSLAELERVSLFHDELETLHLCDGQGMTQEQAGVCMGVSRGTVQRLLAEARRKVAVALVRQQALSISSRCNPPLIVAGDPATPPCN